MSIINIYTSIFIGKGLQIAKATAVKLVSHRDFITSLNTSPPKISYCEENGRLLDEFAQAVTELSLLHEQQFIAVLTADTDFSRFDLLIHLATERKQRAKYAYLNHVDSHGC